MSATRHRPPTITDIARRLGVSTATVSYVLNDTAGSRIPEETRARVRAAADELGYVPHASARSLRKGRSDLVLFAMPATRIGPLASEFFAELAEALRGVGFTLVLHGDSVSRGVRAAREWVGLRPAAVIADRDRLTDAATERLRTAGTVVIALDPAPGATGPTLVFDHVRIGALAGRHLVERGCADIAAIVPRAPVIAGMGQRRLEGLAAEAGTSSGGRVRVRRRDMDATPEEAAGIVAGWRRDGPPDGVFGYNDEFSGLLLGALQDAGLAVPERVRLVGADDTPLCEMVRPRLTTIAMERTESPASVAEWVAATIDGAASSPFAPWTPTLRRRDST